MGLLDRYGTSEGIENVVKSDLERTEKLRPAIEDRYAEVKARIHNTIIEQQLGSENADVSDEGMRKLIDEFELDLALWTALYFAEHRQIKTVEDGHILPVEIKQLHGVVGR